MRDVEKVMFGIGICGKNSDCLVRGILVVILGTPAEGLTIKILKAAKTCIHQDPVFGSFAVVTTVY